MCPLPEPASGPRSFVSGFVSILGRPNTGKSTLLNALVGSKVAIVTHKPQTTRNLLQGVLNRPDAQVVFLDTPGIHKPASRLNQRMMEEVREALESRDLLLLVVDVTTAFGAGDEFALELIRKSGTPSFLVANKIDLLERKELLLPFLESYQCRHAFEELVPISARTGENLDRLLDAIIHRLPEGPEYFPPDHLTDLPARFIAAEIIREKVIVLTRQELPYATAVVVDRFEKANRLLKLHAVIFVEREGQKAIVIGGRGEMLKKIGTQARQEIEQAFGLRIYLELFVKVRRNWRESASFIQGLDWRKMVGRDGPTEDN